MAEQNKILEHIKESKIIAIVRCIPSTSIVDLVEAMVKGGVSCVEVTFDQSSEEKSKDSLKAISLIRETFGDRVAVGAGTVMTVEQVHQAVEAGADIIMLDNMTPEVMKQAVELIDGRAQTECSGNITKENIQKIREIGVDFVSSGALTHSAPILDISMKNLHAV